MKKIIVCIVVLMLAFVAACGQPTDNADETDNGGNQGSQAAQHNDGEETTAQDTPVQETLPPLGGPASFGDTFQFSGSSGRIEMTFGTNVYWGVVDNSWSDHYGATAFGIPITVRNISGATGGLNAFDFTFFGSDGLQLESVGSFFDYDMSWANNKRAGASQTGLLYFLYNGDGEYVIEFSAGFGFGDSAEAVFDIVYGSGAGLDTFNIAAFPASTFVPLPVGDALSLGDTFEFASSSGEVEISIGTDISWTVIDNTWSDYHGADVFSVPVSVSNIGSETGGLNPFDFNMFGSHGLRLAGVGSWLDGDITWAGEMRAGATQEGYFHFLYVGDGQYAIEFAAGFGFGDSVEIVFDISK